MSYIDTHNIMSGPNMPSWTHQTGPSTGLSVICTAENVQYQD